MTSILFVMIRIYGRQFKCNYLKKKTFPEILAPFLKFTSNFEHFETSDDPHRLFISKIMDCEIGG